MLLINNGALQTILILIITMLKTCPSLIFKPDILSKRRRFEFKLFSSESLAPTSLNRSSEDQKHQELIGASTLQLAPMMEYTDRHFRHVVRLISSKTLLHTEMVTSNTLVHERKKGIDEYLSSSLSSSSCLPSEANIRNNYSDQYLRRYLKQGKTKPEGPSVLQLGGSDPQQLREAAQTVMEMTERGWCDYTAINLNCGCPSPKVAGKGCFGAALMDDPKLVTELSNALHDGCDGNLPVTVKCRIGTDTHLEDLFSKERYAGIDSEAEYNRLHNFIEQVASNSPVTDFSVHARIAVLRKSYSPKDNRKVPPLKYEFVHRLVQDFPELKFTLNGGIDTLSHAQRELEACSELNGVMIGRGFAADPWSFSLADKLLYKASPIPVIESTGKTMKNRLQLLTEYGKHADAEEESGDPVKIRRFITKAVTTLFTSEPNAKQYRIALDEIARLPKQLESEGKCLQTHPPLSELILNAAHSHISEEVLLRTPEESYEKKIYEESKANERLGRSSAVLNWQSSRLMTQNE